MTVLKGDTLLVSGSISFRGKISLNYAFLQRLCWLMMVDILSRHSSKAGEGERCNGSGRLYLALQPSASHAMPNKNSPKSLPLSEAPKILH